MNNNDENQLRYPLPMTKQEKEVIIDCLSRCAIGGFGDEDMLNELILKIKTIPPRKYWDC